MGLGRWLLDVERAEQRQFCDLILIGKEKDTNDWWGAFSYTGGKNCAFKCSIPAKLSNPNLNLNLNLIIIRSSYHPGRCIHDSTQSARSSAGKQKHFIHKNKTLTHFQIKLSSFFFNYVLSIYIYIYIWKPLIILSANHH